MSNRFKRIVMIGVVAAFATTGLFAQVKGIAGPDGIVRNVAASPQSSANSDLPTVKSGFGGGLFFEMIPSEDFNPSSSATVFAANQGYLYRSGAGGTNFFGAGLPLKNQRLTQLRLFYEDSNLTIGQNPTLWLCRLYVGNSTGLSPVYECPYSVAGSDAVNGFSSVSIEPDVLIRATEEVAGGLPGEEEVKWVVFAAIPSTDSSIGFSGVRMTWKREVAPPPLTATFGDVPVGSGLHKFVEALYAAGITGGCAGGNFCPGDSLTRGQMAVFLSTALGLHYSP